MAMRKPTAVAFAEFEAHLLDVGLRESLARLLKLTDYRFIGIFRFEDGKANAAVHYDRQNPEQLSTQEVPETAPPTVAAFETVTARSLPPTRCWTNDWPSITRGTRCSRIAVSR